MNTRKTFPAKAKNSTNVQYRHPPFRTLYHLLAGILLLVTTITGVCVFAAQKKVKLPGEDWVSLFNGTDLTGWVKVGKESWTVEDGLIHGKGLTQNYGPGDRQEL